MDRVFRPRSIRSLARGAAFLFLSWSLAGATIVGAQEDPPAEEPPVEAPAVEQPAVAAPTGTKITFHGYLTQAYAQSDGNQIFGITEDGVADYRTAALQIRADVGQNDSFIFQFSHERLGESPIEEVKDDDVELDWLFYEHRFGNSAVKLGRIQIPFGIYNEVKDVGVLLPFYRPSHNFYGEAAYSSETIDGIVLSHDLDLSGGFGLEADVHFGEWEFIQSDFLGGYSINEVDDSLGVELWLDTPLTGVRVGTGAMHYQIATGDGETEWKQYHFSVAAELERFSAHAEVKIADVQTSEVYLGYAHLGVALTDRITLNLQDDLFYIEVPGAPRTKVEEDRAVGLNYAFSPTVVLKLEHHWNDGGFWVENSGLPFGSQLKTRYGILSLSTAF